MTSFTLNGRPRTVQAAPLTPLSTVLREHLNLTGTKVACEEGFCGACTVLVDDEPANACLTPVAHVDGRSVRTIESVGTGAPDVELQHPDLHQRNERPQIRYHRVRLATLFH